MIEWLERCAKANWRLIKDNIPFPEPVAPILTDVQPNDVLSPQS
jgi:hypothetical protein